jgi:hypothetical protein
MPVCFACTNSDPSHMFRKFINPLRAYRYYIAVHDKRTHTLTVRGAPLHIVPRTVKALKALQPAPVSAAERLAARNALQSTFGTKKAVARLRAQERNKVDVDAMAGVAGVLQSTVERNTGALPTKGDFSALGHVMCFGSPLADKVDIAQTKHRSRPTRPGSFPRTMQMPARRRMCTKYMLLRLRLS